MKIAISNRQNLLKINSRKTSALTSFFMKKAARLLPERQWDDISIVVANDALMSSVNLEFMNENRTTDVLSFCFPPMPESEGAFTGEVFVNAQTALSLAKGRPKAASRELALYIAHGCDHLMDQDDNSPQERRRMRSRELRWLCDADKMGILDDFAVPARKTGKTK